MSEALTLESLQSQIDGLKQTDQERQLNYEAVLKDVGEINDGVKKLTRWSMAVDKRLDGIEGRLDGIEGRLDGVDGRLDGIEGRLDGVDGRLDGIEGRLDGVDGRLDGIDGRLGGIEGRLDEMKEMISKLIK